MKPIEKEDRFSHFTETFLGGTGAVNIAPSVQEHQSSCESLGEAAAESTISIIGAHRACPHTGNPTKPARRQMTAPQRQHRWLAADHLEQKSWVTLRSQGDTTREGRG